MHQMRLGKTEINVMRTAFGALPIQRTSKDEAVRLLRKASDNGIEFFDTARMYTDSEEKIGIAFADRRCSVVLATKTMATTRESVLKDIAISLGQLQTDYIDLIQLHNPVALPDPNDPQSSYSGLLEARQKGMVRHIGVTNHSLAIAFAAVRSGLYETIQFPLSSLSSTSDLTLIEECRKADCGLIAMKAIAGGLITNVATSFAFLRQYDNVLPIWGIQKEAELDQFLALEATPPVLDSSLWSIIRKDREELAGRFCRGCGYCLPCPAGIQINWAARMSLLLRRAPYRNFLNEEWRQKMNAIRSCTHCNTCKSKCPYGLDTPTLLQENLADYEQFYQRFH